LNWRQPDDKLIRHIQRKFGCLPVTAAVLANRGITEARQIHSFLNPSLKLIHNGFSMTDMERGVERIARALLNKEKILIFGDYDVDGITSTTLLHEFLKTSAAEVSYYIPHRLGEGYGLRTFHIEEAARKKGIDLIITVDCGSGSHDAVVEALQQGIDVIITDHHAIADPPPPATAVINPHRSDCMAGTQCLAGVGVAFFLMVCLRKHLREINYWSDHEEPNLKAYCDLVALGTVADIVPLINENRVLTQAGLEIINSAPRPGIRALIEVSGINKPFLSAEDIAFRLAPRINAAGRMDHAHLAVELLESADPDQARVIAQSINKLNTERQTTEARLFQRICMHLEEQPEILSRKTLVLAGKDWHEGVLGIVASRLAQRFWRPAVLLSIKGALASGSARSISCIDLYQALSACSDFLENFGGHPMAAGLRLRSEQIDAFREAFETSASQMTGPDVLEPVVDIDAPLEMDMISEQLTNELEWLQPFGPDNEEPLFCARNIEIVRAIPVGKGHQKLLLKQRHSKTGRTIEGIWFNIPEACRSGKNLTELIFKLRWNYWNGDKRIQLIIEDGTWA